MRSIFITYLFPHVQTMCVRLSFQIPLVRHACIEPTLGYFMIYDPVFRLIGRSVIIFLKGGKLQCSYRSTCFSLKLLYSFNSLVLTAALPIKHDLAILGGGSWRTGPSSATSRTISNPCSACADEPNTNWFFSLFFFSRVIR